MTVKIEKEIKLDTIPETEMTLIDLPWVTTDQLDANISVKWIETWDFIWRLHNHDWTFDDWVKLDHGNLINSPEVKYYSEEHLEWSWTYSAWSFAIITWFRPTKITIKAAKVWDEWTSIGTFVENTSWTLKNSCLYVDWSFTNVWDIDAINVIRIKPASTSTTAIITNIVPTWFLIDFPNNNHTFKAIITAEWFE